MGVDMGMQAMRAIAMQVYVGDVCQGCGNAMTQADLEDAVFWPHDKGRAAHEACYIKAGSPKEPPEDSEC